MINFFLLYKSNWCVLRNRNNNIHSLFLFFSCFSFLFSLFHRIIFLQIYTFVVCYAYNYYYFCREGPAVICCWNYFHWYFVHKPSTTQIHVNDFFLQRNSPQKEKKNQYLLLPYKLRRHIEKRWKADMKNKCFFLSERNISFGCFHNCSVHSILVGIQLTYIGDRNARWKLSSSTIFFVFFFHSFSVSFYCICGN